MSEENSTEIRLTPEQHIAAALYEIRDILKTVSSTLAALQNDVSIISKAQECQKFYQTR